MPSEARHLQGQKRTGGPPARHWRFQTETRSPPEQCPKGQVPPCPFRRSGQVPLARRKDLPPQEGCTQLPDGLPDSFRPAAGIPRTPSGAPQGPPVPNGPGQTETEHFQHRTGGQPRTAEASPKNAAAMDGKRSGGSDVRASVPFFPSRPPDETCRNDLPKRYLRQEPEKKERKTAGGSGASLHV